MTQLRSVRNLFAASSEHWFRDSEDPLSWCFYLLKAKIGEPSSHKSVLLFIRFALFPWSCSIQRGQLQGCSHNCDLRHLMKKMSASHEHSDSGVSIEGVSNSMGFVIQSHRGACFSQCAFRSCTLSKEQSPSTLNQNTINAAVPKLFNLLPVAVSIITTKCIGLMPKIDVRTRAFGAADLFLLACRACMGVCIRSQ